ncbi:MAG: GNAT family N-acetyltransferase [Phycisphaerae bacterium]|nr:GNAT family N-acetyltransferase [Phycisphaerae bacterium]MCZ2398639.1 GNAT family N-acetyltransferase [Phycisphaerae bacterium]NUQ48514.1 GNAT family N-acetyltransferase [Phycisphaerae bacterium]
MPKVTYGAGGDTDARELVAFYQRLQHDTAAQPRQIERMMARSAVLVTARADGELIGVARGVSDGVRGYLTECKLDPRYQGPAAVTRTDGRIEHDEHGIAGEMARRVLHQLAAEGVERVDVVAWSTEVDFLAELGFRRNGGLVALMLKAGEPGAASTAQRGVEVGAGAAS